MSAAPPAAKSAQTSTKPTSPEPTPAPKAAPMPSVQPTPPVASEPNEKSEKIDTVINTTAKAHAVPAASAPSPAQSTPPSQSTKTVKPVANSALESIIAVDPETYSPPKTTPETLKQPSLPPMQNQPAPPKAVDPPKPNTSSLLPSTLEKRAALKKELPLLPPANAQMQLPSSSKPDQALPLKAQEPPETILAKAQALVATTSIHKGNHNKFKINRGKEVKIYEFSTTESGCPDGLSYRVGSQSGDWICADKVKVLSQNKPIPYYESKQGE